MEDGAIKSIITLSEYAKTVECCDKCIFNKICGEYWNQCPAYWDRVTRVQEDKEMYKEPIYLDKDKEEIISYDTACERAYDDITPDDLERFFMDGMRSGKFCISDFWDRLPEWMRIDIDNKAFDYHFEYRFDEVMEENENA